MVKWVRELEFDRLRLPAPDWQVLLDVPAELAAERAEQRAEQDADRARDAYERDDDLQRRTGEVYAALAAADWCGRWVIAGPDVDPDALAADSDGSISRRKGETPRVVAEVYRDLVTPWTP